MKGYWAVPILASILILGTLGLQDAWAPTKIAPTKSEAPHPFTIIDTPDGRLVDGSVAVFTLNGESTEFALSTHNPHKTAQGTIPEGTGAGVYDVSFKQPDGTVIDVGTYEIIGGGSEIRPPFIEPTSGVPGTPFTITDDAGRMCGADRIIFAAAGEGPELGTEVSDASFSADCKEATGTVPGVPGSGPHNVTVHEGDPNVNPPLFNALAFDVT